MWSRAPGSLGYYLGDEMQSCHVRVFVAAPQFGQPFEANECKFLSKLVCFLLGVAWLRSTNRVLVLQLCLFVLQHLPKLTLGGCLVWKVFPGRRPVQVSNLGPLKKIPKKTPKSRPIQRSTAKNIRFLRLIFPWLRPYTFKVNEYNWSNEIHSKSNVFSIGNTFPSMVVWSAFLWHDLGTFFPSSLPARVLTTMQVLPSDLNARKSFVQSGEPFAGFLGWVTKNP